MENLYVKLLGALIFYVLMFFVYRYASGKYKKSKNNDKYINWVSTQGEKVKKAVVILAVIYTLAQIAIIVNE